MRKCEIYWMIYRFMKSCVGVNLKLSFTFFKWDSGRKCSYRPRILAFKTGRRRRATGGAAPRTCRSLGSLPVGRNQKKHNSNDSKPTRARVIAWWHSVCLGPEFSLQHQKNSKNGNLRKQLSV